MEDLAVQLFKLGDREHKGFIVKRDMQRLQAEVSLPPEQLEAVFESLDSSQNGYLTLDQFLAGVSDLSSEGEKDSSDGHSELSEPDLYIQRLLGLNVLHKSGELMTEVRGLVGPDDAWHQLLAALFSDLNQLLRQISQLEETLRTRDHVHQQELHRLYDEFETQILEERTSHSKQVSQREARLQAEVTLKQQQILDLEQQRDRLQDRLKDTQAQLSYQRQRTLRTSQTNLDTQGEGSAKEEVESDKRLDRVVDERRERALLQRQSYADGFSLGHHLATLEEEGLVKQLRLLQQMQRSLKSGGKEEKQNTFCYEDI